MITLAGDLCTRMVEPEARQAGMGKGLKLRSAPRRIESKTPGDDDTLVPTWGQGRCDLGARARAQLAGAATGVAGGRGGCRDWGGMVQRLECAALSPSQAHRHRPGSGREAHKIQLGRSGLRRTRCEHAPFIELCLSRLLLGLVILIGNTVSSKCE